MWSVGMIYSWLLIMPELDADRSPPLRFDWEREKLVYRSVISVYRLDFVTYASAWLFPSLPELGKSACLSLLHLFEDLCVEYTR